MDRFDKAIVVFSVLMLMIIALGAVGSADYEDELAEQDFYCEQVTAGHWPDYKGIASEVCHAE